MKRILRAVEKGNTLKTAAALSGVSLPTLMQWQAENPEFREQLQGARGKAEAVHVRQVVTAGKREWRASAWMLERQNPDEWGQRVVLMVKEAFAAAFARLGSELDPATFERVAGILAGLDGEGVVGSSPGRGGDVADSAG